MSAAIGAASGEARAPAREGSEPTQPPAEAGAALIVAPMVNASELPFRALCRRYSATAAFSPMYLAADVVAAPAAAIRRIGEDGGDRPLIVQLAGDNAATMAAAAAIVAPHCDGVDVNLGCPQQYARAGHYGAWMTDKKDWPLVVDVVAAITSAVSLPVSCKIRLQPTLADTIAFAKLLEAAGCAVLTIHGRTRGSVAHRRAGPADLAAIRAVAAAVTIPVIANGNVRCHADLHANLSTIGPDRIAGIMAGEGLLADPSLFDCAAHGCPTPWQSVARRLPWAGHVGARTPAAFEMAGSPATRGPGGAAASADPPPSVAVPGSAGPSIDAVERKRARATHRWGLVRQYLVLVESYAMPHSTAAACGTDAGEGFAAAADSVAVAASGGADCSACSVTARSTDITPPTPPAPMPASLAALIDPLVADERCVLNHVSWMMGRSGESSSVQYEFRGRFKPRQLRDRLLLSPGTHTLASLRALVDEVFAAEVESPTEDYGAAHHVGEPACGAATGAVSAAGEPG